MEFLESLNYWKWGIFALALLILEMLAPGAFFLWLGIAAGVVAVLLFVAPETSWQVQFVVFSFASIVSLYVWQQRLKKQPTATDEPTLNRRGEQYIGRKFTLDVPVVNGVGKIRVDDSTWKIEGEDCEAGTRVEITGVDGVIFRFKTLS